MDFIDFMGDLISLIVDGIGNLLGFIKSIPNLFYDFYTFIPSPFNTIVLVFIPLLVLAVFYKFVRGY